MIKLQPPVFCNLLPIIYGFNSKYSKLQQILQNKRNNIYGIFAHSSSNLLDAKWIGGLMSLHLSLKILRAQKMLSQYWLKKALLKKI